MQYQRLKHLITTTKPKILGEEDKVTMPTSVFMSILRAAIYASPEFDANRYCANHVDVALAIKNKEIPSAIHHFAQTGYFQDFLPGNITIDENFYLTENRDIAQAFKTGQIKDLQKHFENGGYAEGRLPYESYSVWMQV